jgi:hypothetical protein
MSWRGIGAFLLFVVLYMVISPAVGGIAIYAVNNPVVQTIVGVIAAGLGRCRRKDRSVYSLVCHWR